MKRSELIDLIIVRSPGTPERLTQLRQELLAKPTADLEQIVDEQNLKQICAEVAQKFAAEQEAKNREIQQLERARTEELQLLRIFRTPINGRVPVDNQGNRGILRGWLDPIKDESITVQWFQQVLSESANYADSLAWQSADVLDPKKRQQVAAAQDEADRQTFNDFARANGFSEVQANLHLTKSVLGSGFDQYQLAQAVQSGQLQLAPASQEELTKFQTEAAQARADFLRNHATPDELRSAARQETEQRRQAAQRAEQERQIYAREVADAAYGFPPLPTHNYEGVAIDAVYLNKISNTNLPLFKALMRKHGAAALTRRLHGRG